MNAAVREAPGTATQSAVAAIDLKTLRQRVSELPAMPQAVLEVLAALRSETAGVEACAERISRDQAMTARTLRLANSAFYGVPGRVASIRDAIQMLGRRTLGSLLTTAAVSAQFSSKTCPAFDFAGFWRHSLGSAISAQTQARELMLDEDLAFTAGLLHDIGRLALAAHYPDHQAAVQAHAIAQDVHLLVAERAVIAVDHVQLGALIAEHWRFPATVVQAIQGHHEPGAARQPGAGVSLAELVHVADAVTHALDICGAADEMVPELDNATWEHLALSPAQMLRVFERTDDGVTTLCQALGL